MEVYRYNLQELHSIQIQIFKRFINVCSDFGFRYFLGYGSLLGAVRDHGIIPWDDSIDVVMPYEDYAALLSLPEETWGDDLFLQTYDTDPHFPKYYAKLRDNNTTMVTADYAEYDMHHGICINIMPIIKLADDPGERRRQIRDAKLYKSFTEKRPFGKTGTSMYIYTSAVLAVTPEHQLMERRDELKEKVLHYENTDSQECIVLAGNVSLELPLQREWFESAVECEFEGINAKIPEGWNFWLKLRYGDYKKVPIADLQGEKTVNFITVSTTKPYTYYKGKTYCLGTSKSETVEAGKQ